MVILLQINSLIKYSQYTVYNVQKYHNKTNLIHYHTYKVTIFLVGPKSKKLLDSHRLKKSVFWMSLLRTDAFMLIMY